MKYCSKCGAENTQDSKFCLKCGKTFSDENVAVDANFDYFDNGDVKKDEVRKDESSLGKVSMILGIIAICLTTICCVCFPLGIIIGPIAVVLGIIYLNKYHTSPKGMAVAGIVLGAIAFFISLLIFISIPQVIETMKEIVYQTCEQNPYSDECQAYQQTFPDWFK